MWKTIRPPSMWKTIRPNLTGVPGVVAAAVDPQRGYRAKLLRSPERVRGTGLADAIRIKARKTVQIKEFRFKELLEYASLIDMRLVVLLSLMIGSSVWWAMLPEKIFAQPT